MASINKLSIRGIRSFNPDDEEQVIQFCLPLTIIVGANGCGKTTIIESLKYAMTGSLPPGNKSGQTFVHDPKSAGHTKVKASVKLRFTNRAGNSMVVIRSMEVTQKKTSLTFKGLDGILRTTDPQTGERISMSHKCTELDRQIPTMIGVSKPILEHVVFCHQEESSWPLMEGAILKKRFDDIFDSTRYTKALEALRKTRLEYASNVKDIKADLVMYASHQHAANQYREELESTTEKLSVCHDEIQEMGVEVQSETKKMKEAEKIIAQVEVMMDDVSEKLAEVENARAVYNSQRDLLEVDMASSHSRKDLSKMLSEFNEDMISQEIEYKEKTDEMQSVRMIIEDFGKKSSKLNSVKGKLSAEHDANTSLLNQRSILVGKLASDYRVDLQGRGNVGNSQSTAVTNLTSGTGVQTQLQYMGIDTTSKSGKSGIESQMSAGSTVVSSSQHQPVMLNDVEVDRFQRILKEKEQQLRNELNDFKTQLETDQDNFQQQLSELMAKQKAVENEKSRFSNDQRNARREILSLSNHQTQQSRVRKTDVDQARQFSLQALHDRDEMSKNSRLMDIPAEIRHCDAQIDDIQRSIDNDGYLLKDLRSTAEEQNAVRMLESQIKQDVEGVNELLKEQNYLFIKYNLEQPDAVDLRSLEGLYLTVVEKSETLNKELNEEQNDLENKQREATEKQTILQQSDQRKHNLKRKVSILLSDNRGVKKIASVIDEIIQSEAEWDMTSKVSRDVQPQDLLTHMSNTLNDLSSDEDNTETISKAIKTLKKMSKIKDSRGQTTHLECPCCLRNMGADEVVVFSERMGDLANKETSQLILLDKHQIKEDQRKKAMYSNWRKIVANGLNDWLDFDRIKYDLNEVENKVEQVVQEVALLEGELDEMKNSTTELENQMNEIRALLPHVVRARDDGTRIESKREDVRSRKDKLSYMDPSGGGRDLKTVEDDLSKNTEKKDQLVKDISRKNSELSNLNNRISKSSKAASDADMRFRDVEGKYKKDQESSSRKQSLQETIEKCAREEKRLVDQIAPLRQQIKSKEANRNRMRSAAKADEDRMRKNMDSLISDLRSLKSVSQRISGYFRNRSDEELERVIADLTKIDGDICSSKEKLTEMEPRIETLKFQLNEQSRHKKCIEANIKLYDSLENIKRLSEEHSEMHHGVQEISGYETAKGSYKIAEAEKRQKEDQKARSEGRKSGLKDQQRQLKRKLQQEEYKDVDEEHRESMIKFETTTIAISDLEIYYSALDKALLQFHGMKIGDINKIIRELWTLTYKGEDISNIELVSDQGTSKASRSYNYRVVMSKGNTQMDMRGRCSAGQRVLASLVIRLALAETFCISCGVFALDEPTTNLDYENKRGLAIALAQILATRSAQHNFQLLIITHDEDFVTMMKNELATQSGKFPMPDKYFQVSREEGQDGCFYSKINAIDWDEL
mmetsp:Transcript_9009/g.11264  ORF Transcript_9009/g.11264 Transcript_9009/m.11264 type:complete len:1428 (+) Transcript_9009:162-4445(+)